MKGKITFGPYTDVEVIDRPDLRLIDDLLDYWNRKRAGRMGPRLADIDMDEIKAHLPHSILVDVIEGSDDFRYRFIGKRIIEGVGRDNTGKRISEAYRDPPEALAQLQSIFRLPVARKTPIFTRGRVLWVPDGQPRWFTGALLPLSDDGVEVDVVLAEMFVERGRKPR